MSGHSKWATTKHKKAVIDAKRGKLFAKLIKNIEVAARMGGVDIEGNPTLYDAIQKAKKNSVPNDNIERALKRGSGQEAGGADYQTVQYEGYGPNGVAILIECLTDNRNRASTEVRTVLTRNGGNLADAVINALGANRPALIQDLVLAAEVIVERGLCDVEPLGHVVECGAMIALLQEQLHRGAQHGLALFVARAAAAFERHPGRLVGCGGGQSVHLNSIGWCN